MADKYDYWLASIFQLSSEKKRQIIKEVGSAKNFYEMKQEDRRKLQFLTEKQLAYCKQAGMQTEEDLRYHYEQMQKKGIFMYTETEEGYPKRLHLIADRPYALLVRGKLPMEQILCVALVGARECSAYGRYVAGLFGSELAKAGVCIISGMARGIDSTAQEAGLQSGGFVIGVSGCGIDICYPRENIALYDGILKQGGIVSEYTVGVSPLPAFFPARNRILSGLADCVVVIEAKERSGSFITADCALEQGKEVYTIPGRLTDMYSKGCNLLLKQGAGIALSPEDLLEELLLSHKTKKLMLRQESKEIGKKKEFTEAEQAVFQVLDFYPQSLEQIEQVVQSVYPLSLSEILHCLGKLSVFGKVCAVSGNCYVKKELVL